MVGHICRFNPRYAAAKREIDSGAIGKIVSIYARRNIPASVSETVLAKIGPIIGDGVHDTDLMLWFTGANIQSVYSQTHSVRSLRYPDIGWTMYRFNTGAIGAAKTLGSYPRRRRIRSMKRMEILGTEGSLHIQETGPNFSVCDRNGWRLPDTKIPAHLAWSAFRCHPRGIGLLCQLCSERRKARRHDTRRILGSRQSLPCSRGVSREGHRRAGTVSFVSHLPETFEVIARRGG